MAEHPILFNGEMVRAILLGTKTQTRRVVKPQPHGEGPGGYPVPQAIVDCPYGQPGDTLWVRETWKATLMRTGIRPIVKICYRASPGVFNGVLFEDDVLPPLRQLDGKWRPSIHMPRWASRITLEVTGVRVERVQEISEDGARAEGTDICLDDNHADVKACMRGCLDIQYVETRRYVRAFRCLWDSINARRGYGWGSNPWVWRVEFKTAARAAGG